MRKIILIVSSFLFLWGCQSDESTRQDNESTKRAHVESFDESVATPGQIVVKLRQTPSDELNLTRADGGISTGLLSLDEIASQLGARNMTRVFPPAGKFEERTRKAGLHLWYVVEFDENIPVTRAADQFAGSEYIEKVEPVMYVQRTGKSEFVSLEDVSAFARNAAVSSTGMNDPMLPAQWHYENDGSGNRWIAGADIRLFGAWEYTKGRPEVIVSIVDGGIGYTHEDINANMWINQAEMDGAEGVDDDNNGYKDDVYGYNFVNNNGLVLADIHGTHVAGTIAAVNNNGVGVSGIAGGDGSFDSGVRLMSCQIFYDDIRGKEWQATVPNTLAAIKYGADNGAVISQNSWGYPAGHTPSYLSMYVEAVNYFIENAGIDENGIQTGPMKGGLVIFASGNDGKTSISYPAGISSVVSVASFAPNYQPAYYTNYGTWVSICAPGGDFTFGDSGAVLSTIAGYDKGIYKEGYAYLQGTSMACPHVSGIAALYISQYGVGKPGLTPEDVKEALFSTVHNEVDTRYPGVAGRMGVGGVDATAMMKSGDVDPEPQPPYLAVTLPNVVLKGIGSTKTIVLDNYFKDPEGDKLTYGAVVTPEEVVSILSGEGNLHFYAESFGTATVEITATSTSGLQTTATLNVVCVQVVDDGGLGVVKPGGDGGNQIGARPGI